MELLDRLISTVGLLEISDCQTADLSEMSDGLIEIVRICMDTVG